MKLALNCPTSMLESIQPFGDIDWIYANRYLKDETYADYYRHTGNLYKFIEAGTCETGEPSVTIGDLRKVQEELGAGVIVAPDYPHDMQRTIQMYNECLKIKVGDRNIDSGEVVAVLQGATFEEILNLIEIYSMGKSVIAVPYSLKVDSQGRAMTTEWMALTRVAIILSIPADKPVHLLGFASETEFQFYRNRPNVVSINTGVPILQGIKEQDIDPESFHEKKIPTLNQLDEMKLTNEHWGAVTRNIAILRKYINLVG